MQIPLEISTRWIELTPTLEAELRRRAEKLERYYNRITSCRIAVELPTGNHHETGGPYRVRVDITVPGSELVADKQMDDLNAAVRAAFDAAERQVEDFSQRQRGDVKTPVPPLYAEEQGFEEPQASTVSLIENANGALVEEPAAERSLA